MAARSESWVSWRTSTPSTNTAPPVTSWSRGISDASVVLPAPDGPTTATIRPGGISRSTSVSTLPEASPPPKPSDSGPASAGKAKRTRSKRTRPSGSARSPAPGASVIGLGASSTSNTRSKLTNAVITSTLALERLVSGT